MRLRTNTLICGPQLPPAPCAWMRGWTPMDRQASGGAGQQTSNGSHCLGWRSQLTSCGLGERRINRDIQPLRYTAVKQCSCLQAHAGASLHRRRLRHSQGCQAGASEFWQMHCELRRCYDGILRLSKALMQSSAVKMCRSQAL